MKGKTIGVSESVNTIKNAIITEDRLRRAGNRDRSELIYNANNYAVRRADRPEKGCPCPAELPTSMYRWRSCLA